MEHENQDLDEDNTKLIHDFMNESDAYGEQHFHTRHIMTI